MENGAKEIYARRLNKVFTLKFSDCYLDRTAGGHNDRKAMITSNIDIFPTVKNNS